MNARAFLDHVAAETPYGDRLASCIQCGSCGGSCPNGAEMDHTPRGLFAMIQAGQREAVLSSNTMWKCVSCYLCTSRCPQEIPITDVMYTLKRMSIREDLAQDPDATRLARVFTDTVERYGRAHEFGIATRYLLLHRPIAALRMGGLGLKLFGRGRMALRPTRIEEIGQLQAVIAAARAIEARRPVVGGVS